MKRNGNAERRRRENRGAEGAERDGVWGGGNPSPVGEGPGEFSDFLSSNGAFWCILQGACFHLV